MSDTLLITINPDGTATAEFGSATRVFPDLESAVEWAEKMLHDIRTKGDYRG